LRKFNLCRICFRELALQGQIPVVVKSSCYRFCGDGWNVICFIGQPDNWQANGVNIHD